MWCGAIRQEREEIVQGQFQHLDMHPLVAIIVTMMVTMCLCDGVATIRLGFGCRVCNFGTEFHGTIWYDCSKCRILRGHEPFECRICKIGTDFGKFNCKQCRQNSKVSPKHKTTKKTTTTIQPTPKPNCDCLDVDGNIVKTGDMIKIDQCNHCECIEGQRKYCTNRPDCSLYTCEDGHQ